MKTAIVTGANGFVGSHVIYGLLQQNWAVLALGRETESQSWPDRISEALTAGGDGHDLRGELLYGGLDLETGDLDVRALSGRGRRASDTILIHIAGDTRFMPPDPNQQRRINVDGPVKIISALAGKISRVIHTSTAYVSGDRHGVLKEDELDCGQKFQNHYEKSKFDAEVAVKELCGARDLPLVICRPSVVTNDRRTGRASTFTHLNALVEVISRLHRFHNISDGQVASEQLHLRIDPSGHLNLAPVDSLAPLMVRCSISRDAEGKTYNLCHPSPATNQELLGTMAEAVQIRGKLPLVFVKELPKTLNRSEELIHGALEPYFPYLNTQSTYDMTNVRELVPDYLSHFTPVDAPYIRKILDSQRAVKVQRVAAAEARRAQKETSQSR
jgi:nucleoside-diphosphate-sugar epimerase